MCLIDSSGPRGLLGLYERCNRWPRTKKAHIDGECCSWTGWHLRHVFSSQERLDLHLTHWQDAPKDLIGIDLEKTYTHGQGGSVSVNGKFMISRFDVDYPLRCH